MRTAALILSAALSGLAFAGPGDYRCTPAASPQRAGYQSAVVSPAAHKYGFARELVLAEAAYFAFDPNAFDYFAFAAAPLVSPAPTLGVDPDGRELKALPPALPAQAPAIDRQALRAAAQAESAQAARLTGYAPGAPRPAAQANFDGLRASCASCHAEGVKSSGGFSLFARDGSLNRAAAPAALAEIDAGRMPPPSSGRPAVPANEIAQLRGVK